MSFRSLRLSLTFALIAAIIWGGVALVPLLGLGQGQTGGRIAPPPPDIQAPSAIVLDLDARAILIAKQPFAKHPPGELAKIAAALVAYSRGGFDETVRISQAAANAFGWSGNVAEGDRILLGDLVAAMMFRPGSAASLAVAQHIAGSVEAFSRQMAAEAERVGAGSSRFTDPAGLDDEGSATSAYDIALIAAEAMRYPDLRALTGQRRLTLESTGRSLINVNGFLWREPVAFGIKTSYSPTGGHSAVLAVASGGRRLIVAVLGSPTAQARAKDAESLIRYADAHYPALEHAPDVERFAYRLQDGDTLSDLAKRFEVPMSAIRMFNDIADPDALQAGDTLWIPR